MSKEKRGANTKGKLTDGGVRSLLSLLLEMMRDAEGVSILLRPLQAFWQGIQLPLVVLGILDQILAILVFTTPSWLDDDDDDVNVILHCTLQHFLHHPLPNQ